MARKNKPELIDLCSSDSDAASIAPTGCSRRSDPTSRSKRSKYEDFTSSEAQAEYPTKKPPLIFIDGDDGGDNCIITEGLMDTMHQKNFSNVLTWLSAIDSGKLFFLHVQQSDKFSCGYRNMQMMLTALLPLLPKHHAYYGRPNCVYTRDTGHINVPNVKQLQQSMEQAWAAGFDPKGAEFYHNKIVGKKSQIGALEVSYTLLFLGIDCSVVQFIRCSESRSQLGPFCAAYFSKQFCADCTQRDEARASGCYKTANHIVQNLSMQCASRSSPTCRCRSFPLYLQYKGHSVTVVGVDFFSKSNRVKNLLLFDPMISGSKLTKSLSQNDVSPFRRSLSSLEAIDCQIILVSAKSLSKEEREHLKRGNGHVVSAAEDAIRHSL